MPKREKPAGKLQSFKFNQDNFNNNENNGLFDGVEIEK
jgi:hypothetical protein